MYDFNGDCEYVLVERFPRPVGQGGPLESYRVVASNEKNHPFDPMSFTRSVKLEVNGQTYEIRSGGEVFINGIQECLPFKNELLTIRRLFPRRIVSNIVSILKKNHSLPVTTSLQSIDQILK